MPRWVVTCPPSISLTMRRAAPLLTMGWVIPLISLVVVWEGTIWYDMGSAFIELVTPQLVNHLLDSRMHTFFFTVNVNGLFSAPRKAFARNFDDGALSKLSSSFNVGTTTTKDTPKVRVGNKKRYGEGYHIILMVFSFKICNLGCN